jgi:hypothetical protein
MNDKVSVKEREDFFEGPFDSIEEKCYILDRIPIGTIYLSNYIIFRR